MSFHNKDFGNNSIYRTVLHDSPSNSLRWGQQWGRTSRFLQSYENFFRLWLSLGTPVLIWGRQCAFGQFQTLPLPAWRAERGFQVNRLRAFRHHGTKWCHWTTFVLESLHALHTSLPAVASRSLPLLPYMECAFHVQPPGKTLWALTQSFTAAEPPMSPYRSST